MAIHQQPIRFAMTLPETAIIAHEGMVTVFRFQFLAICKSVYHGTQFPHRESALVGKFQILFELIGGHDFIQLTALLRNIVMAEDMFRPKSLNKISAFFSV